MMSSRKESWEEDGKRESCWKGESETHMDISASSDASTLRTST